MEIDFHFVREKILSNQLQVCITPSHSQVATLAEPSQSLFFVFCFSLSLSLSLSYSLHPHWDLLSKDLIFISFRTWKLRGAGDFDALLLLVVLGGWRTASRGHFWIYSNSSIRRSSGRKPREEMARRGNWFSTVKKALSPESKEKKPLKSKSTKKWFGKQKQYNSESTLEDPQPKELKPSCAVNEESNCGGSIEVPTAGSVTTSVAASEDVPDAIQHPPKTQFAGKSREEVAAIKIQTAFRGYLARRALRALRGLVRLKKLMQGSAVKRHAANTLHCLQTLARVQSQIGFRRMRMLEENQALQKQLLQKHAKELENLQMGEEWDDSLQSKEQIDVNLLSRYEAAVRRERAMAYSFSHQKTWKTSSRSVNPMFMDPSNPNWGWSWLERWTATRPWESRAEKEPNREKASRKSVRRGFSAREISKSYAKHQLNAETNSPTASVKANKSTPSTPSKPALPASTRKTKAPSPRSSRAVEDESRSVASMQSERPGRHSMEGGSSVRDDESLGSSQAVPSYMSPTESVRAKSKSQSPFTTEKRETGDKGSPMPPKKRLSFTASPALGRRHSGPPKMESGVSAEAPVGNEIDL